MSISSARTIAFDVLLRVETEGAYAGELLRTHLDSLPDERDRALVTEIVMGALRWQGLLDFFVERYTDKRVSSLDFEVLIALRMGIYQLRWLARIPPHAAINESAELVRRARKKSAIGLVNAVLRRAAAERKRSTDDFVPAETLLVQRMAILHSHPQWLIERWLARFGEEQTQALLEANNRVPEQAVAILDPAHREEILRSMQSEGIETIPGRLARNALLITRGNASKTEAFHNGWIVIQDEASQFIPLLTETRPGDAVLDLCAAPGGKTLALARAAQPKGVVISCDLHEQRLRATRERFRGISSAGNIFFVVLDGTQRLPFRSKFDRILVDAPCSGTGTLARNPEIRWRLKPEDLTDLHVRQAALVSSALDFLAPGGKLHYSTCSLEPEENEAVIAEILCERTEFRLVPIRVDRRILAESLPEKLENALVSSDGIFRTFPPLHHTDGFFAAAFVRAGS